MRKGNGKQRLGAAAVALCLVTGALVIGAIGCSRLKPADVRPGETVQTEESTETAVSPGAENTEDSLEGQKPTDPAPSTILPFPGETDDETEPAEDDQPEGSKRLILGTDIHYLSRTLTDGGERFQQMVEHGDGKVVTYVEQITDAFLEEVIRQKPDVLILSGDLTLEGEKKSHEELAKKLYQVESAGIPVLIIPGNHDINNHAAAQYIGEDRMPAEFTTPEEFREIYRDFGYDEAASEDKLSLSYTFDLDPSTRFLMLDTCQYRRQALVGGAILSDTYDWIEEQLEDAWDNGMNVIPIAHHNLLDESEIYVDNCTIEHSEQLVEMLEDWDISLFLSGHLHVQHTKRSEENRGVWEMVTSSLATPACQYGVLDFWDNGAFSYHTRAVDVQGWARKNGRKEEDLLEFDTFKEPFLRRVFYNQSYDKLMGIPGLTDDQRKRMSELYSDLNYHYYQGTAYLVKEETEKSPDYQLWLEDGSLTILSDYVQYIVYDAKRDYNQASSGDNDK